MPVMTVGTGRALIPTGINYNDLVMGTQPIAYWPQSESSGLVARCLVNPLQDGTYTGVTLANDNTGPFGTPAPRYDGATSYCNVMSAALTAAFSGILGSILTWIKVLNVGIWTDAAWHVYLMFYVDGTNYIQLAKTNANNNLRWVMVSGGAISQRDNVAVASTAWMPVGLTWNQAANRVRAYRYGIQDGGDIAGIGVWAGAFARNVLGANTTVPASPWNGWQGPTVVWNRELSPAEVKVYSLS